MNKFVRYLTVTFFVTIIYVSGNNLQEISGQYAAEHKIKNELTKYRPALPALIEKNAGTSAQAHNNTILDLSGELNAGPAVSPAQTANPEITDMRNAVNCDIIGWLYVPDTHIDYPVVIATDNDYYLRRDIHRNQANAGSIFMDYRCAGFSTFNTIIYGHSMKNKSMFGDLRLFGDPDFFDAHLKGALFTADGTYILNIFAYIVVGFDDKIIYDPAADRDIFFEYVKKYARRYREPLSGDVVTLSTCAYEYEGARSAVLATIEW